jgi:hypothetical protein
MGCSRTITSTIQKGRSLGIEQPFILGGGGKPWEIAMRRGALIGLVGGLFAGPTMLLWLLLYSFVRPNRDLGSTAILGPFMGGIESTVLGTVFGAVAGAVCGLLGIHFKGLRRCILFAAILMAVVGTLEAFGDYSTNPERFAAWAAMIIGMDVACPIMAGIAAGALIGWRADGHHQLDHQHFS